MNAAERRIHLVTGILERDGALLLTASQYPNQPGPLWNLPGGRQRDGELLRESLLREVREETTLAASVGPLRYVAESYDRATGTHFVNFCFTFEATGDAARGPGDAHVVAVAWVPRVKLAQYLHVAVVREPLLRHLTDPAQRYFGFADAGISIEFADSS